MRQSHQSLSDTAGKSGLQHGSSHHEESGHHDYYR